MTRDIDLINAEVLDCCRELGDCVRYYASLQVVRADGLERSGNYLSGISEQQREEEERWSAELQADLRICKMKEEELRMKYHRLIAEYLERQRRGEK